jgi:hypothetical protein
VLTAHVRTCAKHPMREQAKELDAWKRLAMARGKLEWCDPEDAVTAWKDLRALGIDPVAGERT